jgi:type IV pilus assembly protein PilV
VTGAGSRAAQRGVTLVEVLVAIVVLATGLLGVAALQTAALQLNHSAVVRSQAVLAANEVIDRMRANRSAAADYEIELDDEAPDLEDGAADSVAESDLAAWRAQLSAALPSGTGSVEVDDETVTVVIQWLDLNDADVAHAARDTDTSFEFRTRL